VQHALDQALHRWRDLVRNLAVRALGNHISRPLDLRKPLYALTHARSQCVHEQLTTARQAEGVLQRRGGRYAFGIDFTAHELKSGSQGRANPEEAIGQPGTLPHRVSVALGQADQ
jgi:hypothetical protein